MTQDNQQNITENQLNKTTTNSLWTFDLPAYHKRITHTKSKKIWEFTGTMETLLFTPSLSHQFRKSLLKGSYVLGQTKSGCPCTLRSVSCTSMIAGDSHKNSGGCFCPLMVLCGKAYLVLGHLFLGTLLKPAS